MSPYIFILYMKFLSHLINKAGFEKKKWKPITIPGSDIGFSHLFFADDLILVGVNDPQTI